MSSEHPLPSLRQLFDEHARYIFRSLRHLGVADSDVEDQCQEVFPTVHRKLPEFAGRSTLRTWLYGICLRVASDYRRRAYVRRERPTAEMPVADVGFVGALPPAQPDSRTTLLAMLAVLDDDKRDVLVLYEIEGFTMKEVAEIVGCPLQTAYSRLYAAREALTLVAKSEAGAE